MSLIPNMSRESGERSYVLLYHLYCSFNEKCQLLLVFFLMIRSLGGSINNFKVYCLIRLILESLIYTDELSQKWTADWIYSFTYVRLRTWCRNALKRGTVLHLTNGKLCLNNYHHAAIVSTSFSIMVKYARFDYYIRLMKAALQNLTQKWVSCITRPSKHWKFVMK